MTSTTAPPAAPAAALNADGRPAPAEPVSFEEFHDWLDEDTHAEWVDGRIIVTSPSNIVHQRLAGFLYRLLVAVVEKRQLGEVLSTPFLMRLPSRPSGREPDLLFIATEHLDRLQPTYLDGPADLVVGVVSPDSDARDRSEKFGEYEGAGIPEYWLIDPIRREALFYRLGEDGRYHLAPIGADGIYHSSVLPGLALRVAWLWQRPLPSVRDVTRELGV